MFGVHFAVSAGRCTRGAFLQLFKVADELSAVTKCDYVLIIDTEGLRAPELDVQDTHHHDNELATLVTGLANVTIINIFGEVPAEINDILQTTVLAILRMNKIKLKPSCQFVKHHVANVTANKTNEGRQKFQTKLDEMTVLAAKQEHYESQFRCFSDVIAFNDKGDVHNFPSLWEGNPPMAPINSSYCEAAFKLKSRLISLCKSPSFRCTLDEFAKRVSILWEAVLKENFVFSFKNTLEREAYDALETECGKWFWRLQKAMLSWQHETSNVIVYCDISNYETIQQKQNEKIEDKLDKEHEKIMEDVCQFFEDPNSSLVPLMVKWRERYEIKIKAMRDDLVVRAKRFCADRIQNRRAKIEVDNKQRTYRDHFKKQVKDSVDGFLAARRKKCCYY